MRGLPVNFEAVLNMEPKNALLVVLCTTLTALIVWSVRRLVKELDQVKSEYPSIKKSLESYRAKMSEISLQFNMDMMKANREIQSFNLTVESEIDRLKKVVIGTEKTSIANRAKMQEVSDQINKNFKEIPVISKDIFEIKKGQVESFGKIRLLEENNEVHKKNLLKVIKYIKGKE